MPINSRSTVQYGSPPAGTHGASRKRILLYGPPVNLKTQGLIGGGAGGYARNMACYLSTLDLEKYVLVPAYHTVRKHFSDSLLSKICRFAIDAWTSLHVLIRQRPAAVHVLAQYRDALPRELFIAFACKMLRVPYIYDIKAGAFVHAYNVRGPWYRCAVDFIIRNAAGILGEGRLYLEFLEARHNVKATYFPNFVPVNEIPSTLPALLVNAEIVALFAGRCYAGKGVFELVEGCRMAARRGVALRLILIGDEDEEFRAYMDEVPAEKGLKIERLGSRTHSEVLGYMAQSDLFCFPTRHSGEGHSNAINEAMMNGMVILTTRQGFIPDVLGEDGAYYLDSAGAGEIADRITFIAENRQDAVERARRGRARLMRAFTSAAASERLNRFYAETLG